ncbi:MAG: LytR/AlgR family response regulator transcription factor [Gemmatimonadota bacterium]
MTIRTAIIDDEPLARRRITDLLEDRGDYEVVGEFTTGGEARQALTDLEPDLVFLDIQMPDLDGFGLLRSLDMERPPPAIIFVTAYDQYAPRAFDVDAVDYLVKPFADERFDLALERARREIEGNGEGSLRDRILRVLDEANRRASAGKDRSGDEHPSLERIVIKTGDRVLFTKTEDIDWIEAANYYAKVHVGPNTHLVRESLNRFERRLDPRRFARIHRSTIVNLDRVKELRPWFHGAYLVIIEDGTELRMSRGQRLKLWDRLNKT